VPNELDDERLLAALREAVRVRQAVPDGFIDTAKNIHAWHNIDAELAQLTFDSSTDVEQGAPVRSETASIRTLIFSSDHMSIELEVADERLLGQIIPPREGTVETQTQTGTAGVAPVDVTGCFSVDPTPVRPFRLRCRTADGVDVVTGWITL